mmetsp:Transcript_40052/g.52457  ORF Transcript_40052/g.52457 Transcript_40052/m.52457 type:complete len:210 (-) Transcript_40052:646-1275(-)
MLSQKSTTSAKEENCSQVSSKKRTAVQAGITDFFAKAAFGNPQKRPKLTASVAMKSTNSRIKPPFTSVKKASVKPEAASETAQGEKNLRTLLNFQVPMGSVSDYEKLFADIAEAYLNHTVLEVRPCGSRNAKYFRVAEIEFYLNDYKVHKDTFTHGDSMQKQTGKWYFHKFGNSYRSGTYKGLDVAIGKGDKVAAGGILLRSLMPLTMA